MKPLVSVIIPSFNHAVYIEDAIKSVLSQDYENIELIVVDDGSIDNTHNILSNLPLNDRLIIILNKKNKGQSAVLNQALKVSKGEYICLLPSDDWFLPGKISCQVEIFNRCDSETGLVYGKGLNYFSDSKNTIPDESPMHRGWVLEKLIKQPNFVFPASPMFKRECFEFARPDETYKAEGEAIYLKLAIKYKFEYVNEFVAVMRDHKFNTGKKSNMMYVDNLRYWNEFFMRPDLQQSIRKLKSIPISRLHRLKGLELVMLNHDFSGGRTALLNSIWANFYYLFDFKVLVGILISFLPKSIFKRLISMRK